MRLLSLDLLRWGPFSDLRLDFSNPARALHLVVGSNEAGKSTTLRAITGLFFGIPANTSDDHRHKPDELRLSGRIAAEDGAELVFLRRKGKKGHTLKNAQGEAMDEERLRRFLGNIEENQFKMMFGLSHERLVEGGHALVEGKGDLGESLYGAGLGQAGVSSLLRKLGQKADEIFTPQARTRKLNQAINKFKAAKEIQKEASHSMRQWDDQKKQKETLEASRQAMAAQLEHAAREQRRLLRVKRALRPIAERAEVLAELERRRDDVVLPDSAPEDRRAAEKVIRDAGPRQAQLTAEITDLELHVDKLVVPEKLLEQATSIRQLAEDLGSYRKARHEAVQIQTALHDAEDHLRNVCKRLKREPDDVLAGKDVGTMVSLALEKRVKLLIKQRLEMDARIREATKSLQAAEAKLAHENQRGQTLPPPVPMERLTVALDAARREGDLDKRIRERAKEAEQLGQRVRLRFASLEECGLTFERIGALPIPAAETVKRFERDVQRKDDELRTLQRDVESKRQALAKINGDLAIATRGGDVPTQADVDAARSARNASWAALRRMMFESSPAASSDEGALRETSMLQRFEALSAYEAAVQRVDVLADRLFHEADRVARIADMMLKKENAEREIADGERLLQRLVEERNHLWTQWVETWQSSGIKPLSPAEMKDFLVVYGQLVDELLRWRDAEAVLTADRHRAAEHAEALASLLPDASASEGLARLIERAAAACQRETRAQQEREAHARDLQNATVYFDEKRRDLEREKSEIVHWASLWEKALVEMALPLETTTAEVEETLGLLADLGKRVQELQDKRRRLAIIEHDEASFRKRTLEMAERFEEPTSDMTMDVLAAALVDRFHAAQQDDVKRKTLHVQLEDKRRELAELGLRRQAAESEIEALCSAARVSLALDLPQAEERSKKVRDLRTQLGNVERQILDLGEGIPLEALVAECEGLSGDQVAEQLAALQEKMTALSDSKAKADQDLGGAMQRLALVDGSARAAEAAEEAEQHLASMATLVEEYARAKLAHRLLEDEIKRHREKNQGPIIRRASELFERLTLGSFVGIRGDNEGDDGKPVLECVRLGGSPVRVEGLSDGSRDQLFLALRIASLERYFENNEPIPFVLDDILVNFDDARSRASLAVLGELSRKTQVLFFTHHARVAELAEEATVSGELRVHNLNELGKIARMQLTA